MKIKVSVCSEDVLYCERLVNYFNSHYYDRFQWNVFTQSAYLQNIFESNTADLILVGGEWKEELQKVEEASGSRRLWAYLVENDEEQEEGNRYLKKYRRADQINSDLLNLYAQKDYIEDEREDQTFVGRTSLIAFVSAGGGIGASTIACAAAKAFSRIEKVLYLNLENLGSCEMVFAGESRSGLDELVYAAKSRRNTLKLKIESSVSRDEAGTYYFKECTNPLDLQTLSSEDIGELLKKIGALAEYDKVIIDLGNGMQDKEITVMSMANRVIMVMDHSEIAMHKLQRYLKFAQAVEEVRKVDIISKMQIYFNKSLKSMQLPEHISHIRVGGAFPLIKNGDYTGIIDKIAKMEMMQNIR